MMFNPMFHLHAWIWGILTMYLWGCDTLGVFYSCRLLVISRYSCTLYPGLFYFLRIWYHFLLQVQVLYVGVLLCCCHRHGNGRCERYMINASLLHQFPRTLLLSTFVLSTITTSCSLSLCDSE